MESILIKYRHIFHEEGSNDFRGTDLVEHRPGAKIRHVDALSRHVQAITTEQSLSKNLFRAEQKRDNFCTTLQVGKQKGRSEIFMMRRELSTGDERTGNIHC